MTDAWRELSVCLTRMPMLESVELLKKFKRAGYQYHQIHWSCFSMIANASDSDKEMASDLKSYFARLQTSGRLTTSHFAEMKTAGHAISDILKTLKVFWVDHWDPGYGQMIEGAGYKVADWRNAGMSTKDLYLYSNHTVKELMKEYTTEQLKEGGYDDQLLHEEKKGFAQFYHDNMEVSEVRTANTALAEASYTRQDAITAMTRWLGARDGRRWRELREENSEWLHEPARVVMAVSAHARQSAVPWCSRCAKYADCAHLLAKHQHDMDAVAKPNGILTAILELDKLFLGKPQPGMQTCERTKQEQAATTLGEKERERNLRYSKCGHIPDALTFIATIKHHCGKKPRRLTNQTLKRDTPGETNEPTRGPLMKDFSEIWDELLAPITEEELIPSRCLLYFEWRTGIPLHNSHRHTCNAKADSNLEAHGQLWTS